VKFTAGSNCWRVSRAHRFGWLIDGAEYFAALRASLGKAEREILILGWDIDSRTELVRDPDHPHYPSPLAETLERLVRNKPELRVHVLSWDFSVIYVLERELMPARSFGWQDSERLHFRLDGRHPVGASQHQKIVVIDGLLAFLGGIDLTKARWDTRRHAADETRRRDPDGNTYRPFHDVQAVISGPAAADLRELADERWMNATGESLPALDTERGSARRTWPDDVRVRCKDVDAAIARTWIQADCDREIHEVRELYLDTIRSARRYIYIENQYFTSPEITAVLEERLREDSPPEIAIVMPGETSGWLEQATMDVLRNEAFNRLREADAHDRLKIVSPVFDELGDTCINVHAKIMVADGRIARIGSANLSQRSMGLDTECDVVVEDGCAEMLAADLLAEHMGKSVEEVADSLGQDGLFATIDRFNGGPRRLEPLQTPGDELEQAVLRPMAQIADLEKPLLRNSSQEAGDDSGTTMHTPVSGWMFIGVVAAILGLWIYLGILGAGHDFEPRAVLDGLRELAAHPLAPWVAVPAFVAASLVVTPVTAMIALCGLLFEPWAAVLSATAGVLASTAVNHWLGAHFGNAISARIPGGVAERIRRIADASDMWSLAGLRLIPVAPFSIVNLVAGASGVGLRDFLAGTLIGMGPGIVLICLSVDRARAALQGESVFEPWIVAAIAAAGAAVIGLRAWQRKSQSSGD
jgi:phospholipase D1/2